MCITELIKLGRVELYCSPEGWKAELT